MRAYSHDQIIVQLLTDRDCSRVAHKIWTQRVAARRPRQACWRCSGCDEGSRPPQSGRHVPALGAGLATVFAALKETRMR
jgi:hypothetical protein